MRTIRRTTTLLATLALAGACGGGGGGPTGPDGPDIRGTYAGSPPAAGHAFSIRFGNDDPSVIGCPGAVVVSTSSGGSFGGTFRIDPCVLLGIEESISIPILSGTVQESGTIRFIVLGQDGIVEGLQEEGCELVDVEDAFTGAIAGATLSASIAADVRCPDPAGGPDLVEVRVTWTFEGTRTS